MDIFQDLQLKIQILLMVEKFLLKLEPQLLKQYQKKYIKDILYQLLNQDLKVMMISTLI